MKVTCARPDFFFFCLLLIGIVKGFPVDEQRASVIDFHRDCMEIHGVLEETIHDALDGTTPVDHEFFLHAFCVAKKAKLIDDDGVVNTDNVEEDLKGVIFEENMENVAALIRKCLVQKADPISTIKAATHCFLNEEHNL